jgi:hypothetical protein
VKTKPGFTVFGKLKGVNHKLPFLRVGAMNPACTPALCELTKVWVLAILFRRYRCLVRC